MDFRERYFPDNNLPKPSKTDALKPLKRSDSVLDCLTSARGMLIARAEYQTKVAEATEDIFACIQGLKEGLAMSNVDATELRSVHDLEDHMESCRSWAVKGLDFSQKALSRLSHEPSSAHEKQMQLKLAQYTIEHLNFALPTMQKEHAISKTYFAMLRRGLHTFDEETFGKHHSVISSCTKSIEPLYQHIVEMDTAYRDTVRSLTPSAPPPAGKSV